MIVTADPHVARQWTVLTSVTRRVAIVPTMGALHDGHLSLVRRAHEIADEVVVTIFVNPAQFAPNEDLTRYPRPIDEDLAALRHEGVSLVFLPSNDAIYPPGFSTYIEPPAVAQPLEGLLRPGHFRGVCTVVLKLFQIIPAAVAVFGQKDYQQSLVVAAMVKDLDVAISLDVAQTVRETDGLAMSSRNRYLTTDQRRRALCLWQSLSRARELFNQGQRERCQLEAAMIEALKAGRPNGVDRVEYAVVVDPQTLLPMNTIDARAVALVAAKVGTTRLIDNLILG
jgi:pantoate--beta-alanine ligase